jgi:asparagine synthase (glutamine-hydrolysing)
MCGIAGIATREKHLPESDRLDALAKALVHRGPDGAGFCAKDRVGLVNTRLAIIDIKHGNQPFQTDTAVSVVNGEIYNDLDIRASLPGARYRTGSDSESALQLYCAKGNGFVDGLRGMYAAAVYDCGSARLLLARDPFGIKPLYYTATPDGLVFASEAQALLKAGFGDRRIDARKRAELLQLKFTTGRQTIFPAISRVAPGETIVVSDGRIVDRHRRAVLPESRSKRLDAATALARLDTLLMESVKVHVRSDVPYGLFLSGGIDSSALLAAMTRLEAGRVIAFTAVFPESVAADESHAAARAAKAVGADHHTVPLTKRDFWLTAPRVAAALDDPTTDAAALPTFALAACARSHGVKVVLSGEGADEIFGGYSRYRRAAWLGGMLARKTRTHGAFDDLLNGSNALAGWRDGLDEVEREENGRDRSPVQRVQAIDCAEWLPNDLLTKFDRCTMAHGVEGRTPFLDPVLGPFAFGLPDDLKVKRGLGKWLLRQWLADNLPSAEAFAKKTGFNPPIGEWIDAHGAELTGQVAAQPGVAEMSLGDGVGRTIAGATKHPQAAWNLVFYALWHSHHVLGVSPDGSIGDVLAEAARRG